MHSQRAQSLASRPGGLWLDTSSPVGSSGLSSFVSCEPALWLRGSGNILEVVPGPAGDRGWLRRACAADPGPGPSFDRLAAIARRLRIPAALPGARELSPRFRGGLAGCFSYDLGRRFETVPDRLGGGLPWEFLVGLYDEVLELDGEACHHHVLPGGGERLLQLWDAAEEPQLRLDAGAETRPVPELAEEEHGERVEAIRELIRAGSLYQANLTLRFRAQASDPDAPLATFLRLRRDNPSPYGLYQALPGTSIVSSSPESFLELTSAGHVRSRPIKGTASRGRPGPEDEAARVDLLDSTKDRAELSMIVDLVRNDIGRVCVPGSVDRSPHLAAEAHPSVWHLVGDVHGRLAPGRDAFDLLRSSFPPGSCIGAPKIRAMSVLEDLELSRRGPYTGALGWIGADGSMALSVAIRTLVFREGQVSYGVGGGIVFDSCAQSEWREALLKGLALARALRPSTTEHLTWTDTGQRSESRAAREVPG